jgi:nitroimidazol reductase NimA-like FMN-containing flavoprotein (pyridoxamine 5'-phosphate oxidase superfamily)
MISIDAHSGLERMDRDECLRLLEAEDVGRLAIVQGHAPAIFPINYALDGDSIIFRTAPGTKLLHGPRALAAFEIDSLTREDRSGWSVVVTGRLEEITRFDEPLLTRVRQLRLEPWAGGTRDHWMRLIPGIITGRRVGPPGSTSTDSAPAP